MVIKFGKWLTRHKAVVLIIAFLLLIPATIGYVSTQINYDLLSYLPNSLETVSGQDTMVDEFGMGAFSMVVVEDMEKKDIVALKEKLKKVNDYKFVYSVTNGVKTKERTLIVSVVDTTKPTIELTQSEITLNNGEQFNPKDYIKKAEDNYDQLSTDNVVINNSIDSNKDGDYEVEYQLKDQHGNVAISTLKVHIRTVSQNEDNTAVGNKEDSTVKKNQEQNNKSNKVETPKTVNIEPKIFYIKDYNYDLSACSQAASNYMNQVLNSSNISLSGYIEPFQEENIIVGYKVTFV